ncbi:hypothetical protein NDU88_005917 [Pleurodeles waltl]|uniref:Uncharacterized protein n=1 Tax=Pleurodeles waltl TaxID=8319 RepID=A0AAV7MXP5_PLEWA|nr:hypothetical protein NDU88_005917 [Pleurodeles waltl]
MAMGPAADNKHMAELGHPPTRARRAAVPRAPPANDAPPVRLLRFKGTAAQREHHERIPTLGHIGDKSILRHRALKQHRTLGTRVSSDKRHYSIITGTGNRNILKYRARIIARR